MKLALLYPVKPLRINQGFGERPEVYSRFGISGHNGVDFYTVHGQPVYASHDGEVSYAGVDSSEGYGVVLRTLVPYDYKDGQAHYKTIYWHLLKNIPVKAGQKVKAGELLGYADNTGFSTGDHLHFGLKPQIAGENDWTWSNLEQTNGYNGAIDPKPYFNGFFAEDNQKIISLYEKVVLLLNSILKKL